MKRLNSVTTFLISAIIGIISLCCVTTASAQTEEYPWDVNGDGIVDIDDLMFVGSHFGDSSVTSADVNGDGLVNIADLVLVGVHFGEEYKPTMPNEIIGNDGAPMVLIPAGEFQMGDAFNEGPSNGLPVHLVYIDAFYMDKYEVTNAQYRKFMDATGHVAPGYWNDSRFNAPQQPVVGVSWYDAAAYAEWAGKRLPTEAEWEKAARGGLAGKRYPWGDEAPDSGGVYRANYDPGINAADGYAYTAPVGSFEPNGYRLHDMAGNVWEWCADWCDSGYYANSPYNNPLGPDSGAYRAMRGGSWLNGPWRSLRVAFRGSFLPTGANDFLGFRCVSQY